MNKLCRARAVPSASILHVIRSLQTPFEQMNMLELIQVRPSSASSLPGPVGKVAAGGQGVRVVGAQHPLEDGQQHRVLVPGPGRISRQPGVAGKVGAGGQGVPVLRP